MIYWGPYISTGVMLHYYCLDVGITVVELFGSKGSGKCANIWYEVVGLGVAIFNECGNGMQW